MNKFIVFPLLAVFAMLVSCSGSDSGNGPELPEEKNEVFFGKLLFGGSSIADDTKCTLHIVGDSASVTLCGVSFAPAMPAMDIVIPGLACEKKNGTYFIKGKDIVPTVKGAPVTRYKMSSVDASLTDDKFVLNTVTAMGTIGFSNAYVEIKPVVSGKSYKGDLLSGDFVKEIVVDLDTDEASSTMDVVLNDVKFAANMPLTLNITLKDVPYVEYDGIITFNAENIAPYMNSETEPAPAYMFAVVEGSVSGSNLLLSAKMASGLAPYLAGMEFVFNGVEVAK